MHIQGRVKCLMILGSTRPSEDMSPFPSRVGERIQKFLLSQLPPDEFEVIVVDPTEDEFKLPLLEWPYHWSKALKRPIDPKIQRLNDFVAWADCFIFVTPEYNHSMAPALVNLLNHIAPPPYGGKTGYKPSHIVTYSMQKAGGARAGVQLRTMASELGTLVCSKMTSLSEAHILIDTEGNEIPDAKNKTPMTDYFIQGKTELLFVARAMNQARAQLAASQPTKSKL